MKSRIETDSMGSVHVPIDRLWGAQTQRSLENFPIGQNKMPKPVIDALVLVKRAAAKLNHDRGALSAQIAEAIIAACDEILAGQHGEEFPLSVWQTGSGTHTNMNCNEVIANRANELLGAQRGAKFPVHPNDHVNMAQSSNDAFSAAMYIAGAREINGRLIPAIDKLSQTFAEHSRQWDLIVKVGRTHLMDATPMTFGQEAGAWAAQIHAARVAIGQAESGLHQMALGATAVGTGLNAPRGWGADMAREVSSLTGIKFTTAPNKFAAIASHDGLLFVMGALVTLGAALTKVANDIRLLASGPRCGVGELGLPANEPGSSIMPGKVNPSQAEALLMVCARVAGNHATAFVAASSGLLQLNVAKPLLALCLLESCTLFADAINSFRERCAQGISVNLANTQLHVERNLMMATALTPAIGYDAAVAVAKFALEKNVSLRDAAMAQTTLSGAAFDVLISAATTF